MWFPKAISTKRLLFALATFGLFFLFTLLLMPYGPRKWLSVQPTTADTASKTRLNIILLSEPRSGSSFTGEIFQQHNDVFYLYEPLFHFLPLKKEFPETQNQYNVAVFSFLSSIFTCNLNDSVYVDELKTPRNRMRCPEPSNSRSLWVSRSCRVRPTRKNIEDICKRRKLTVAKLLITRLPGLTSPVTKELIFFCNSSSDFECLFIYLVRDPRAVISSLLDIGFFDRPTKTILKSGKYSKEYLLKLVEPRARKICRMVKENIDYIRRLSTRLEKKVLILRYEDLVSAPTMVVQDLYHFAGLGMTKNIAQWLRENTRPPKEEALRNKNKPYSTVRNSLEELCKWRKNEQPYVVKIVEESCKEAMEGLGYIPLRGSEALQKNLRVPLFTKYNPLIEDMKGERGKDRSE